MPRGRKPLPSAIALMRGNPGHRKISKGEPKPTQGIPKPPEWLDLKALEEWRNVTPELKRMGVLTMIDHAVLGLYCQAMSDIHNARAMIRKFGAVVKQDGRLQLSPYVRIANAAAIMAHKFASEYGFTPSSRLRLSVSPVDSEQDKLDKETFG